MTNFSIEDTRKRTERYWYEDGIWEIGFGLINLLLAGYFSLLQWAPLDKIPVLVLIVLQLAALVGIFGGVNQLVRLLKGKITYPRTGYVAYRRGTLKARARRILLIGLLSAGIGAIITLISTNQNISSATPLVIGIIMCGMIIYLGNRFGLLHMYILAGLTLTLSLAASLLPVEENLAQVLFFGSYGLIFIGSGAWGLAGYLHRTRPPGKAQESVDYVAPDSLEED